MIPFYGDQQRLRETVMSVIQQTSPNWRLFVVDDDLRHRDLPSWLTGLADERVTYIRNETNLGANQNFQRCVELATASRMTILGSDDLLDVNYVEVIETASRQYPDATMIQPGVRIIDESGRNILPLADRVKSLLSRRWSKNGELHDGDRLAASLLHGDWLYFPSIAWQTEQLKAVGFRPGTDVVMDVEVILELLARGGNLLLEPTVCFRYRRHLTSESSWRALEGSRFAEEARLFSEAAIRFDRLGWPRAARAARWHITSRLHALTLIPSAFMTGRPRIVPLLLRHAFG